MNSFVRRAPDQSVLRELVRDSGLSPRTTQRSWIFRCPRCGKDKFHLQKSDGRFICFSRSCTADRFGGAPEYGLAELLQISVRECRAKLYGGEVALEQGAWEPMGMMEFVGVTRDDWIEEQSYRELEWPSDYLPIEDSRSARGLEYLANRGVSPARAVEYGLRYCPRERRVVFPVVVGGRLLGWQGRLIVDHRYVDDDGSVKEGTKILSSDDIPPVWMFQDRLENSPHILVAEGPFDAIKAHLCSGNVAGMGCGATTAPARFRAARSAGVRAVYLGLDPDAAEETARLVQEFSDLPCYQLDIPDGTDLGAMEERHVYDLFRRARRVYSNDLFIYMPPPGLEVLCPPRR